MEENVKLLETLNNALVRQYERHTKVKLKFNGESVIYNKKRQPLSISLREEIRKDMYEVLSDMLIKSVDH